MDVLETCLYAEDLEAAAEFYGGLLGLRKVSHVPGRHVFFQAGRSMVLIFNPAATRQETVLPPHGAEGPGHVAFAVPAAEIPAWRSQLEAAGLPILTEHAWPRGGASIYIADPAGNIVELAPPAIWGLEHEVAS